MKRSWCHWNHGPGPSGLRVPLLSASKISYQPISVTGACSTVPPKAAASSWPPKHTPRMGVPRSAASLTMSISVKIQLSISSVLVSERIEPMGTSTS